MRALSCTFTPSGLRFVPFPDDCAITVAGHRVFLRAVIVEDRIGQVVAEIVRDVRSRGRIRHHADGSGHRPSQFRPPAGS
ncbi:MAG: hypothetical protein ACLP8S_34530 [Solirubrobacteraceae bacterium]